MSEEKNIETKAIATEQSPPELTPEQKKNEAKDGALGCLVLIVLIAVAWYFGKGFFTSEPINYITQDNTQERVAEKVLLDVWGAKTNWKGNPPRLKDISTMQLINNGKALEIRFRVEDNITSSFIANGFIMQCAEAIPKLFAAPELKNITLIRFFGTLTLVDKYGKEEESAVSKLFMTRRLAEKIQWDNVPTDNIPKLIKEDGEQFWLHPAIRD